MTLRASSWAQCTDRRAPEERRWTRADVDPAALAGPEHSDDELLGGAELDALLRAHVADRRHRVAFHLQRMGKGLRDVVEITGLHHSTVKRLRRAIPLLLRAMHRHRELRSGDAATALLRAMPDWLHRQVWLRYERGLPLDAIAEIIGVPRAGNGSADGVPLNVSGVVESVRRHASRLGAEPYLDAVEELRRRMRAGL